MNNTDRFLFVWLYRSFPLRLGSGCDCQIGDNRSIVSRRVRVYWRWWSRNHVGRPKVSVPSR